MSIVWRWTSSFPCVVWLCSPVGTAELNHVECDICVCVYSLDKNLVCKFTFPLVLAQCPQKTKSEIKECVRDFMGGYVTQEEQSMEGGRFTLIGWPSWQCVWAILELILYGKETPLYSHQLQII